MCRSGTSRTFGNSYGLIHYESTIYSGIVVGTDWEKLLVRRRASIKNEKTNGERGEEGIQQRGKWGWEDRDGGDVSGEEKQEGRGGRKTEEKQRRG